MNPTDLVIGGVSLGPIIALIIQVLKRVGLPDGYAGWANLVLSVLAYGLLLLTQQVPQIEAGVVGVLKLLAFIAATFGGALVSYLALKKSEVFK